MVYFILAEEVKRIKIGYCKEGGLDLRLKCLQGGSPVRLKLIVSIPKAGYKEEQRLHEKFKNLRFKGEWFDYTAEIENFILKLKDRNPYQKRRLIPQFHKEKNEIKKSNFDVDEHAVRFDSLLAKDLYSLLDGLPFA